MDQTISISGMSCGHCVAAVRKALATVPGVVTKDVMIGSAVLDLGSEPAALDRVGVALEDAGYDLVAGRTLKITSPSPSPSPSPEA